MPKRANENESERGGHPEIRAYRGMQRNALAQSRQSCVRMDRQYSLHLWAQLTMRYFRRHFRRVLLARHSKWNTPRDGGGSWVSPIYLHLGWLLSPLVSNDYEIGFLSSSIDMKVRPDSALGIGG